MSHTPGPWTVQLNARKLPWDSPRLEVLTVAEAAKDVLEQTIVAGAVNDADGRLIASAPDLLAALENIAPLMGEVRCEIHGRRVLTDVEPPSMGCDGCLYVSLSSTGDRDARAAIAKAIGTEVSA